ncbi:Tnks2 [Symbiodinium natans]|uniref:Tnks2 protein n=1 Tax=Symbiodinium natans TaxID=878477 RepID=A0A812JRY9_9DINO|nr:Tnks2 [Symbiodinium natans]
MLLQQERVNYEKQIEDLQQDVTGKSVLLDSKAAEVLSLKNKNTALEGRLVELAEEKDAEMRSIKANAAKLADKRDAEIRRLKSTAEDSEVQQLVLGRQLKDLAKEKDQEASLLQKQVTAAWEREESYRQGSQLEVALLTDLGPGPWVQLQQVLRKTAHCQGGCSPMQDVHILKVEKIHNTSLWSRYMNTKERLRRELRDDKAGGYFWAQGALGSGS